MSSVYVFVKKSQVTQAMINRSTSAMLEHCPEYLVKNDWWLFSTNDVFVVLEIPSDSLKITNVFDNYQWYSSDNALRKIGEFEASQL